jgi:PTS system fructose-specific IIC component
MPDGSPVIVISGVAVLVLIALIVVVLTVRHGRSVRSLSVRPAARAATRPGRDARAAQDAPVTSAVVPGALSPVAISTGAGHRAKTLLDYIDERTIVLDVDDADRDTVIRRLAAMMCETGRVHDEDSVVRAALHRELISTTGIGEGIAIPHAQCDGASEPVLAFARSSAGVDWKSLDEQPAHLIFMIAVPEAAAGTEHLRVLAQLSRSLMKPSFRAAIELAATPADVLSVLASTVPPWASAPH